VIGDVGLQVFPLVTDFQNTPKIMQKKYAKKKRETEQYLNQLKV